jgi:ABC-type sugar transport system ATPase subunit
VALQDVTLDILPGEVHAFVGQNGAGKSTLVKILSGAVEPSEGQILLRGETVRLASPVAAVARGIATITQEMNLVPTLSVAENVLIGHLPTRRGRIDWAETRHIARELLTELGLDLDPDARVQDLSVAQRQGVEVARALSRQASIVIMDEPTSALAAPEIERLLETVLRLRERGTSIIYVSHKMDEVFRISDRISVFREGRCLATLDKTQTDHDAVVHLMVGQALSAGLTHRGREPEGEPVLEVEGLTSAGKFSDVSFRLYPGEVLGFSGLVGAGRTEVVRALFGADPIDAGVVRIAGEPVKTPRPDRMIALGVGLVPEDRRTQGLLLGMSVRDNLVLVNLARRAAYGLRRLVAEKAAALGMVQTLSIRAPGLSTPTATLSGGNQQKVAIGKWLGASPRILIFDEPTRGIDIAAKGEILRIIEELAQSGVAIILVSSEQADVLEVSDRILVMREGRIVAELRRDEANPEVLTQAAFGRVPQPATHAGGELQ